ncbi:MAG: 23S rRNA (uracil(1939)-C(5))-methyltransferase RlmD [Legionella sp.]|nr:23S rRNA (uracil(1939)-C(5))-methyltransferase RlmD [Legionella sp.]
MSRANFKRVPKVQTATIDTLSHDGRGVARLDGKATFIKGALPGEQVEFQYSSVKKDFDEGFVLSVLKPSPLRVEPKCPHYHLCGGCSMQHVSAEDQIQLKQNQLLDLITRYGHTKPEKVLEALTGPHWNYRNKARLSVRYVEKKQYALVGFRERNNPRYITEISQCPVMHAKVAEDIIVLRQLIDDMEDKHCIAQVEVAAGDTDIALILRNLRPLNEADQEKIKQFAQKHQYKLYLQPGGPDSVTCFYPPGAETYLTYRLDAYDLTFNFHPNDFTQVNAHINQSMVQRALELMDLQKTDKILDLFCGLGNFTLPMAKFCAKVVGIEGSETMVQRAYFNAKTNDINNVEFFSANLDDVAALSRLSDQSFNKILIDPPRSGALEIVKQIDILNPERIVYVSCNPITLARDTDILVNQKGYVLKCAGVLDMFPHTTHVESIALFVKG